jgi:hypothetical protein
MLKTIFDGAENDKFPGILVAGTHSRAGKTTIARLKVGAGQLRSSALSFLHGFADKFVGAR